MINGIKITDLHSHILPRADHGSDSLDMTKQQLTLLLEHGVDTVVATPHFYPDRHSVESFEETVENAANEIKESDIIRPEICLGAEVLYCRGLEEMDGIDRLCIRGTRALFLELPMTGLNRDICDTVRELSREYTVILAHIDRYISSYGEEIESYINVGAYAQINASSFFSFGMRKKLQPFIEGGRLIGLGSDLHEVDKKAVKNFSEVYKKLECYEEIMANAEKLLLNAEKI